MQRIGKNIVFPKSLSAIGDENITKSPGLSQKAAPKKE
jgi:hypothetical protein